MKPPMLFLTFIILFTCSLVKASEQQLPPIQLKAPDNSTFLLERTRRPVNSEKTWHEIIDEALQKDKHDVIFQVFNVSYGSHNERRFYLGIEHTPAEEECPFGCYKLTFSDRATPPKQSFQLNPYAFPFYIENFSAMYPFVYNHHPEVVSEMMEHGYMEYAEYPYPTEQLPLQPSNTTDPSLKKLKKIIGAQQGSITKLTNALKALEQRLAQQENSSSSATSTASDRHSPTPTESDHLATPSAALPKAMPSAPKEQNPNPSFAAIASKAFQEKKVVASPATVFSPKPAAAEKAVASATSSTDKTHAKPEKSTSQPAPPYHRAPRATKKPIDTTTLVIIDMLPDKPVAAAQSVVTQPTQESSPVKQESMEPATPKRGEPKKTAPAQKPDAPEEMQKALEQDYVTKNYAGAIEKLTTLDQTSNIFLNGLMDIVRLVLSENTPHTFPHLTTIIQTFLAGLHVHLLGNDNTCVLYRYLVKSTEDHKQKIAYLRKGLACGDVRAGLWMHSLLVKQYEEENPERTLCKYKDCPHNRALAFLTNKKTERPSCFESLHLGILLGTAGCPNIKPTRIIFLDTMHKEAKEHAAAYPEEIALLKTRLDAYNEKRPELFTSMQKEGLSFAELHPLFTADFKEHLKTTPIPPTEDSIAMLQVIASCLFSRAESVGDIMNVVNANLATVMGVFYVDCLLANPQVNPKVTLTPKETITLARTVYESFDHIYDYLQTQKHPYLGYIGTVCKTLNQLLQEDDCRKKFIRISLDLAQTTDKQIQTQLLAPLFDDIRNLNDSTIDPFLAALRKQGKDLYPHIKKFLKKHPRVPTDQEIRLRLETVVKQKDHS